MENNIKENELDEILKYFNKITGLKVTLFDDKRTVLAEYPKSHCSFCHYINTINSYKCENCNWEAFEESRKKRIPHIYECHMGLLEIVFPLTKNDKIIGFAMFGQITNKKDHSHIINKLNENRKEIDYNTAIELIDSIKYHSNSSLQAEIKILEICCTYILTKQMIQYKETLYDRIIDYINKVDLKTFKIENLCSHLGVSRTLVYSTFAKHKDIGIAEYVRDIKIKKATELLKNGDHSIKEIAYMTGFTDSNHFIKVFRLYNNDLTPKQYRKMFEN